MICRINIHQWLKAFLIVLKGRPIDLGNHYAKKQSALIGVITTIIASPFITLIFSLPYQGSVANTVFAKYGNVIFKNEQRGMKHVAVADFITQDKRTIRLQDTFASLPEIEAYELSNPTKPVYVEGYYLNNGDGHFWITFATTHDGKVLITRQERLRMLAVRQQAFGKVLLSIYICLGLPLWLVSIFNILKVRKSLGA